MQELYNNYHCPDCGTICIRVDDPDCDFIKIICPKCGELVCIMERPAQPWSNYLDYQSVDPYYPSSKGWIE